MGRTKGAKNKQKTGPSWKVKETLNRQNELKDKLKVVIEGPEETQRKINNKIAETIDLYIKQG